jgi:hypothetical protein
MNLISFNGRVDFFKPLAAPDAVTHAVADSLRNSGCVVRQVSTGVVEFDTRGPGGAISGGVAWIDPAAPDRRMWLALRVGPLHAALMLAAACAAAAIDIQPALRSLILCVMAVLFWMHLDESRSVYEGLVQDAARRA